MTSPGCSGAHLELSLPGSATAGTGGGHQTPAFQPPAVVFPVAWTALYTSIAVASAKTLKGSDKQQAEAYWAALLFNLTLNSAWSWVFFKGHKLAFSSTLAAALALSSADLARRAGKTSKNAGLLLLPYTAWCIFATVLTTAIWQMNMDE